MGLPKGCMSGQAPQYVCLRRNCRRESSFPHLDNQYLYFFLSLLTSSNNGSEGQQCRKEQGKCCRYSELGPGHGHLGSGDFHLFCVMGENRLHAIADWSPAGLAKGLLGPRILDTIFFFASCHWAEILDPIFLGPVLWKMTSTDLLSDAFPNFPFLPFNMSLFLMAAWSWWRATGQG